MRAFYITLFVFLFNICLGQNNNSDKHLFPITEQNKIGFIDSSGKIIIKPVFLSAGEFSEGLAPARIAGTYGYIDKTGKFVIRPKYDYATNFSEGLAIVYIGDKPFFINKSGQKIFENTFAIISPFKNGRSIVQTSSKKYGCIDKTGKLVIDTIFSQINRFVDGLAVVHGPSHYHYADGENNFNKKLEVGVIDSLGQFIIPYGNIEIIDNLDNGYFKAIIPPDSNYMNMDNRNTALFDRNGNIVVFKNYENHSFIEGVPHDGLIKIKLHKPRNSESIGTLNPSTNAYMGYINLKGESVINDTNFFYVTDFYNNRAFVNHNGKYSIIDTTGRIITETQFDEIKTTKFFNGKAFVMIDEKWGLIDTNGNFVIKPQYAGIELMDPNYFFFTRPNGSISFQELNGVSSIDGRILIEPIIQEYDKKGFQNGLLKCIIDNKTCYINLHGKVVWRERNRSELYNLNIDYMQTNYFLADSHPKNHRRHTSSGNYPKAINRHLNLPSDKLSLIIRCDMKTTFNGQYNGFVAFVANTTSDEYSFCSMDGNLYMNIQALDKKRQWRDIEKVRVPSCLNALYYPSLPPQSYWSFAIPAYKGEFKTKLRLKLTCFLNENKLRDQKNNDEIILYSNEFNGSINPGQFWRSFHAPRGLMDLYNE